MRIPRFWKQESATSNLPNGRHVEVACWGWSEQFTNDKDQTHAIVTRNSYGSLILNTGDLMFIDVDFPPKSPQVALPKFLRGLLGQPDPVDPETKLQKEIVATARKYSVYSFRVYRTRNGFRVMVHSHPIQADSELARSLLADFDADPLYQRMCKNQDCFRARLTPKAWRCRIPKPPGRFPFETSVQESAYRDWEKMYSKGIAGYSTCRYVETVGSDQPDASLVGLIELHDQLTKASTPDPLA